MTTTHRVTPFLALILLGLVALLRPLHLQAEDAHVINLHSQGPVPQRLTISAGSTVIWVSHLAPTKLVVTTVAFAEGQAVAQGSKAVEGYNGFAIEAEHLVGRMQGNGGKVALRFVTPGAYTYIVDHQGHMSGTIVVRQ